MPDGQLYRRTAAGKAAWQRQDAQVPLEYRRILGLIDSDTHADSLRTRLAHYSQAEMLHLLEELVEEGLLEAVVASKKHNLDFTDSLNLADIKKAHEQQDDLDFTGSFNFKKTTR
jgi:hypothetical protein